MPLNGTLPTQRSSGQSMELLQMFGLLSMSATLVSMGLYLILEPLRRLRCQPPEIQRKEAREDVS